MGDCVLRELRAAEDTCAYALENCNNHDVLPFIHYYFCQGNENWIGLLVFTVLEL
jgi:sodium/potassium/calcium exchanger 6